MQHSNIKNPVMWLDLKVVRAEFLSSVSQDLICHARCRAGKRMSGESVAVKIRMVAIA